MAYVSLEKVYYTNRQEYEAEYLRRMNGISSVKIDFDISGHQAFYVVVPEMMEMLYRINMFDKKIIALRAALPSVALTQYFTKSLQEEVYQSLDIEGVYSTRKEISDARKGPATNRLHSMVRRYVMLEQGGNITLSSCKDIRAIYDEVCLDEVLRENPKNAPDGTIFRTEPAHVYTKADNLIHSGLFPENKIDEAMTKALKFLTREEIDMIVRTAVFHYMLEYIHPFYDGNGRLGRYICSCLLATVLDPLIGVRLSYSINMNRQAYYKMFKDANEKKNRGDLTSFILEFLRILMVSYDNLFLALDKRVKDLNDAFDKLVLPIQDEKTSNVIQVLLQATLFGHQGVTKNELAEYSNAGLRVVNRILKCNEYASWVAMEKDGKRKLYRLNKDTVEGALNA